jgi:Flp pilus assembly protein TadB
VKDIHDDFRVAISQHDVASNGDAFAIGRRRGKPALKFDGNKDNAAFQAWRKRAAKHKLSLKPRRQAVSLGETRREVSIVIGVPTPKFVAVMFGKPVAATIVIIVVVSVSAPVPPMSVVVVLAAVLVMLVLICKNRASRKHKESENDGRKPFSIFQESPPR